MTVRASAHATCLLALALTLTVAEGCGGKIAAGDVADGGSDTLSDAIPPDAEPIESCAYANGVRACGSLCPRAQEDCFPACLRAGNVENSEAPVGFCVADASKMGETKDLCAYCDPGTVCRIAWPATGPTAPNDSFGVLSCVTPLYCEALHKLGFDAACLWNDKTWWHSGESIPERPCPAGGQEGGLCGGACGDCASGLVCTGRSPSHPAGVCAPLYHNCGVDPTVATGCLSGEACAVWNVGSGGSQTYANLDGFCMPVDDCRRARGALSGGLLCYGDHAAPFP